jgi:hypothetical protein
MPIRINLLAESQAAEEARRKDPVKRTILIGSGLVAVVIFWIGMLMMQVRSSNTLMVAQAARLATLTNDYVAVSNNFRIYTDLDRKVSALTKYATNRFLWGATLDALQRATVSNVWVVQLSSMQMFQTNAEFKAETNLAIELKFPRKWYQLRPTDTKTNVAAVLTNTYGFLTSRVQFLTGRVDAILKNELVTNKEKTMVTGKLIAVRPVSTVEMITINVKGRDFSSPAGSLIESFTNAVLSNPYFSNYLSRTNTSVDRDVRPVSDPADKFNTNMHVAFEVKCLFPPRIRANEK